VVHARKSNKFRDQAEQTHSPVPTDRINLRKFLAALGVKDG
jgi:hypothetical protein